MLLSMVNEDVTMNINGELFAPVSENENSEKTEGAQNGLEDLLKMGQSGENGLKMGALLFEILNAFQESNQKDLPVNTINETEGNTGDEKIITDLCNLLSSRPQLINEQSAYQAIPRI